MNKENIRIFLFSIILGVGAFALTACNTAEGFGEDVESAGEEIEEEF